MKHPLVRLILLCIALHSAAGAAEGRRPNIVLFLIDDLGWRDIGANGSTYYQTPNIDRLAREGVRFTDAYAACAVCSPTRAAVLTGKYPARLLLTDWLPNGRWDPKSRLRSALRPQPPARGDHARRGPARRRLPHGEHREMAPRRGAVLAA
jgi:arylsulfatase A-like enzyme